MRFMKRIKYFISHPGEIIWAMTVHGAFRWVPDEVFLKHEYKRRTGRKLNLKNPRTFNEKLQWLKIHDRKANYSDMVDKYEVKKLVANAVGEAYIIPVLGVWDRFEDIDFGKLPRQFVLKCTHDSGSTVICCNKEEFNLEAARAFLNKRLKMNYYDRAREWPYKNVRPRIIAERYMTEEDDASVLSNLKSISQTARRLADDSWGALWNALSENEMATVEASSDSRMSNLSRQFLSRNIQNSMKLFCDREGRYFGEMSLCFGTDKDKITQCIDQVGISGIIELPEKEGLIIRIDDNMLVWIHEMEPIKDYKVLCFAGSAQYVQVHNGRNTFKGHTMDVYDREWNRIEVAWGCPMATEAIEKPKEMDEILALSEKMAKGVRFLRVDWYIINHKIYFGEFTFFDGGGWDLFDPDEWDYHFGDLISL